jgi:hypothetical protein
MNHVRPSISGLRSLLLAGLGWLSAGCSEELGPVPMPVTRVRGVVRQGREPLWKGWIEFVPVDGTIGNIRSARLRKDGSFDADKVAVGKNLIRLIDAPIQPRLPAQLFSTFLSPIRRDILPEPGQSLDIDLVDEAIRFSSARARTVSSDSARSGGSR